jgi:hypothetical protein
MEIAVPVAGFAREKTAGVSRQGAEHCVVSGKCAVMLLSTLTRGSAGIRRADPHLERKTLGELTT